MNKLCGCFPSRASGGAASAEAATPTAASNGRCISDRCSTRCRNTMTAVAVVLFASLIAGGVLGVMNQLPGSLQASIPQPAMYAAIAVGGLGELALVVCMFKKSCCSNRPEAPQMSAEDMEEGIDPTKDTTVGPGPAPVERTEDEKQLAVKNAVKKIQQDLVERRHETIRLRAVKQIAGEFDFVEVAAAFEKETGMKITLEGKDIKLSTFAFITE